jgi:hypothetical protein
MATMAKEQFALNGYGVAPAALAVGTSCTIPAKVTVAGAFEDPDGIGGCNCLIHNLNLARGILFGNTK